MSRLIDQLDKAGYAGRVITERQLASFVEGSKARRYGLVNRALKDGSLVRLKRGLYILGSARGTAIHPFAIAQALLPGSYISLETALSYHGWIPEAVYVTSSITPDRKSLEHDHEQFGRFTFHPLAINRYQFLAGVGRVEVGDRHALVASPLRALIDLVAYRKTAWAGLDWIEQGLRIDHQTLLGLRIKDFEALRPVYKHKAANAFLKDFECAIRALKEGNHTHRSHHREVAL